MAGFEETFERLSFKNGLRAPLLSTAAEYAELALHLYQRHRLTLDSCYEIVRPLGFCPVFSYPFEDESLEVADWCHVSFLAKHRYSDSDDLVLFFVELADFSFGDKLSLNYFKISKPGAPGITNGCRFCPPDENHPHIRGAHFAGQWDFKPTNDTSQEEMALRFQRQVISKRKNPYFNPNFRRRMWPSLVKPDPSCFSPVLSGDEYALLALSDINKVEKVEYELVHTLYSHHDEFELDMYGYGHWCHVCFFAKPKNKEDVSLHVYPVHFFAELNDPGLRKYSLTAYTRMGPNEGNRSCGMCPAGKKYPHPWAVSYIAGRWPQY